MFKSIAYWREDLLNIAQNWIYLLWKCLVVSELLVGENVTNRCRNEQSDGEQSDFSSITVKKVGRKKKDLVNIGLFL